MNKTLYIVTASALGAEAAQAIYDLRWMLIFIIWLLAANLWFSVSCNAKAKRLTSFAKEGRKACNKLVDYLAYLMSGAILGLAIFEPLGVANHTETAAAGLILGCVWEIESIADKVCELHGIRQRHCIRQTLWKMAKNKFKWLSDD